MAKLAEDERAYCHVLRVVMIAFIKGNAPILAVEIGRRAIPGHLRPRFQQAEEACRGDVRRSAGGRSGVPEDKWRVQPIIIKRKAAHGGHHGGAWKVAYADFVTAMMALFIVLWLVNSSKQVQDAVGGYFRDPKGNAKKIGSNLSGAGENFTLAKQDMSKLKEQLQNAIRRVAELDKLKNQIEMTVTSEGLRIELLESDTGTFFETGSSHPTPRARNCWRCSLRSWASCRTRFPSRATPTRSPLPLEWRTATGSSPPTAPMPPADLMQENQPCGRPGVTSARLCRPATAQTRPAVRLFESQGFADRAISAARGPRGAALAPGHSQAPAKADARASKH